MDSFIWWHFASSISDGGGIHVQKGLLAVRGSTISHNLTGGPGGGIANGTFNTPGGEVLIADSFIGHNDGDYGAGLFNSGIMEMVNTLTMSH